MVDMNAVYFSIFLSVAAAHFLALLSPGADFVLIVRNGISKPWKRAVGIAFGISAANGAYIALCLAGLGAVVAGAPFLLAAIRIFGGLYLCWLGFCGFRSSKDRVYSFKESVEPVPLAQEKRTLFLKEFTTGFLASVLNPKLPLFYLGLFSFSIGDSISFTFKLTLGIWMVAVVLLWDIFILRVLSRPTIRRSFLSCVWVIDRISGVFLLVLGIRILLLR
jgi:threonine/homoserine/homoserine lactone efflux protein